MVEASIRPLGEMDNHKIHMELTLVEFDSFRLLNSGFRWLRPEEQ